LPKENAIQPDEENNTEEVLNTKNFNPDIVEKSRRGDPAGSKLMRLKQNLKEPDAIIGYVKDYYALILSDGSILINDSLVFPNVSDTKIVYYDHISRQYGGAYVDISQFTIILENNQTIKARIFSPYKNVRHDSIYFDSNNNQNATKGYYEYGNAINAFKNNTLKTIVNKANIEITISSDYNYESHHHYIKLGPESKYYDWVIDRYSYFLIDIYSEENTPEMETYVNRIIEDINFY
jgi:hypothetical protein